MLVGVRQNKYNTLERGDIMTKGRPRISVRMEDADRAKLRSIAKAKNITVSELLRAIIYEYLKDK